MSSSGVRAGRGLGAGRAGRVIFNSGSTGPGGSSTEEVGAGSGETRDVGGGCWRRGPRGRPVGNDEEVGAAMFLEWFRGPRGGEWDSG